jgi:hypothetical protein
MNTLSVPTQHAESAKQARHVALFPQWLAEERKFRNPRPSESFSSTVQQYWQEWKGKRAHIHVKTLLSLCEVSTFDPAFNVFRHLRQIESLFLRRFQYQGLDAVSPHKALINPIYADVKR